LGTYSLELTSPQLAKLLRFALYNHRRKVNKFKNLRIILDENRITIYKPIEIIIKRPNPNPNPEQAA
jgi:hypothetical protein